MGGSGPRRGPGAGRRRGVYRAEAGPIAITQDAFEAIAATLPLGSVGYENAVNERGERLIWLEAARGRSSQRDARGGRELFVILRLTADRPSGA
jgi:hypothetical protein